MRTAEPPFSSFPFPDPDQRTDNPVPVRNPKRLAAKGESAMLAIMSDLCRLFWCALVGLFRSRAALAAEVLVLRHQLNVLQRRRPKRIAFSNVDRRVFTGLYRLAPAVLDALKIVKPETVIRWHRAGFRAYWRWKSHSRGGRPSTPADIRRLIREMSNANPLWGATWPFAALAQEPGGSTASE